jgi:hypothetical protein
MNIILSMMGINSKNLPAAFKLWRIVEWPGEGSGHPSWAQLAARLRSPDGRLLPTLAKMYRFESANQVVAVGFSAGSSSGCRELLRHPLDRAALAAAVLCDGAHAALKTWLKYDPAAPEKYFADWKTQVAPLRDAFSDGMAVFMTASQVDPGPGLSKTALVMRAIRDSLKADNVEFESAPGPLTAAFPSVQSELRCNVGPGGKQIEFSGADKAAHIFQANEVIPNLLENYVKPLL